MSDQRGASENETRRFKHGLKTGVEATDDRLRTGLRKQKQRRQDRLAMRRGRDRTTGNFPIHTQEQRKRTEIVEFRELKAKVKHALTQWFSFASANETEVLQMSLYAMEGLSAALLFKNRDLALSAYPELFSGDQGKELLRRITAFVALGITKPMPTQEAVVEIRNQLFRVAVSCVTEIMYEPENIACVEVLCSHNIHGIALSHLIQQVADASTSSTRQDLLEMLGNTARNNRYARQIVLESHGLMEMIYANLNDAMVREDWALISAVFYMMYVLCETCNGGETPPLAFFEPIMPNFINIIARIVSMPFEREQDIDDAYLGAIAFLEALCLSDGRVNQEVTPLLIERRKGILALANDGSVRLALFQAINYGKRSIQKKAVAALSFMCTHGVDAMHPLIVNGLIPVLMEPMRKVSVEGYTKRHILRLFFLITKYDTAYMQLMYNYGALEYLCQALIGHMGSLDSNQHNYATWALCRAVLCGIEDPLELKKYLNALSGPFCAIQALTEALHRSITGGDMETANDILKALRRFFEFVPHDSKEQLEEADGLAALSKIMHQAHVQSEPYKQATYIYDTYFSNY